MIAGTLALLVFLASTEQEQPQILLPREIPFTVRVLVLNFDPQVDGKPLHRVCDWNDPKKLAEEYIVDVRLSSSSYIQYKIVEWRDIDAFPVKTDGFGYTVESYLKCWREGKGWHKPDGLDYEKLLADYGVIEQINANKIDELWLFGGPYFGYWESAMAGPGAFYINGGVYEKVGSNRAFAIMGFNYERGVAEMLHNLCHRTESTMTRIYGGWKADELTTPWAKFAANEKQSGTAAVGTCHYPPNAEKEYDYANKRYVNSTADDWLTYPVLRGISKQVNCETWGGPDYHRNYLRWWFRHLPGAYGTTPDGRQTNWWKYVFNFNAYDERGLPKPRKS